MMSIALAYWEMRRISRSRGAIIAILAAPVLAFAFCLFYHDSALRRLFPILAAFIALILLYARYSSDKASGFASGIDSTPAVGAVVVISRVLVWLMIAAVQIITFYAIVRLVA